MLVPACILPFNAFCCIHRLHYFLVQKKNSRYMDPQTQKCASNMEACSSCGQKPAFHTETAIKTQTEPKTQRPFKAILWLPQNRPNHTKRKNTEKPTQKQQPTFLLCRYTWLLYTKASTKHTKTAVTRQKSFQAPAFLASFCILKICVAKLVKNTIRKTSTTIPIL
jgi:hypothetical protein